MTKLPLNTGPILPVPGNSGHRYGVSYQDRSRCSHLNRERGGFLGKNWPCSQLIWEQGEQELKLAAYVFPLFPGTGRYIENL